MNALAAPARTWPLDSRLPLLDAWPADGRDRMIDLSALPRFGLRGPGTAAWLSGQGCPLPGSIHEVAGAGGMTRRRRPKPAPAPRPRCRSPRHPTWRRCADAG